MTKKKKEERAECRRGGVWEGRSVGGAELRESRRDGQEKQSEGGSETDGQTKQTKKNQALATA